MKRTLLILLCSTALGLRATTLEEERRFVRESVEWILDKPNPKKWQRWHQEIKPALNMFSKDVRISVYCELLAGNMGNLAFVDHIIPAFLEDDGLNTASAGNAEALALTRKTLEAYEGKQFLIEWAACHYLALKGDEGDLDTINKSVHKYYAKTLLQRIAGTNVICHLVHATRNMIPEGEFSVVPSVANTGPQGAYVEAILRQCWDGLEAEFYPGDYRNLRFKDRLKMPAELLTMVVWFDADGNPACNVDLGKYGLSMPTPDMLAQSKIQPSPTNRLWWLVSCIPCLLVLLLWAKARRVAWLIARTLRPPLRCALRYAVLGGGAWACCFISCLLWRWTEYKDMEIAGPYHYLGFPIWVIGGGGLIPCRFYVNIAVWFLFFCLIRAVATGYVIRAVPNTLIPFWRRIVYSVLMGLTLVGLLMLWAYARYSHPWLYWGVLAMLFPFLLLSLRWYRTGRVFGRWADDDYIPLNRWIVAVIGIIFLTLISVYFNKILPVMQMKNIPWEKRLTELCK